ncbi:MAG: LysM peptidoglycan-binding domain-containing protein [Planctomycetota bacterium]|nr:MAG: LysM peptidoglycan-binding domain-containing protein [Planctomycetota bacterium]
MHRDTKLGLALAILVMGFAAALCFPRVTPTDVRDELTLTTASELDASIRMMPIRSYTDAENRTLPVPVTPVAEVPPATEPTLAEATPEPIVGLPPDQTATHQPSESGPISAHADAEPGASVPQRVYRVQPGDSLSRIARRELGSESHSERLFQANREVLSSPDRLVPGMELLIPEIEAPQRNPEERTDGSVAGQEALSETTTPPPTVPVNRAPHPPSSADRPARLFRAPGRISSESTVRPQ